MLIFKRLEWRVLALGLVVGCRVAEQKLPAPPDPPVLTKTEERESAQGHALAGGEQEVIHNRK